MEKISLRTAGAGRDVQCDKHNLNRDGDFNIKHIFDYNIEHYNWNQHHNDFHKLFQCNHNHSNKHQYHNEWNYEYYNQQRFYD